MKRITAENEYGDYYFVEGENACPNELAKYIGEREDLEEELGLDLITVFKALSGYIAIRQNDGSIQVSKFSHRLRKKPVAIDEEKNKLIEEYCIMRGDGDFMLKDYGKTWALTRKELEKDEV